MDKYRRARLEHDRAAELSRGRLQQLDRTGRDRHDVDACPRRVVAAPKVEQAPDDSADLVDLVEDHLEPRLQAVVATILGDKFGAAGDHVERRAELMRDTRREGADHVEPFGMTKLIDRRPSQGALVLDVTVQAIDDPARREE